MNEKLVIHLGIKVKNTTQISIGNIQKKPNRNCQSLQLAILMLPRKSTNIQLMEILSENGLLLQKLLENAVITNIIFQLVAMAKENNQMATSGHLNYCSHMY